MSLTYHEDSLLDLTINRKNIQSVHTMITRRGTHIEMVSSPELGLTCYMDNALQSCEADESLYHEALVHPAMAHTYHKKRVMIVGGGEGATAREVLKWPDVEHIDMYEWDEDVVSLFKEKYPQWAKGAWHDNRLHIHYHDIFNAIQTHPEKQYDVIIIDLFDYSEEDKNKWANLLFHLPYWSNGSICIYAGLRSGLRSGLQSGLRNGQCMPKKEQSYQVIAQMLRQHASPISILQRLQSPHSVSIHDAFIADNEIIPYRVFIPSFLGEATFLLIKFRPTIMMYDNVKHLSHITKDIWKSYKTFNW